MSLPKNSSVDPKRRDSVTVYNRFSRPNTSGGEGVGVSATATPSTSTWRLPTTRTTKSIDGQESGTFEILEMRRHPTIQFVENTISDAV